MSHLRKPNIHFKHIYDLRWNKISNTFLPRLQKKTFTMNVMAKSLVQNQMMTPICASTVGKKQRKFQRLYLTNASWNRSLSSKVIMVGRTTCKKADCLAVVAWLTQFHCLYTLLSNICSNEVQTIGVMSTVQFRVSTYFQARLHYIDWLICNWVRGLAALVHLGLNWWALCAPFRFIGALLPSQSSRWPPDLHYNKMEPRCARLSEARASHSQRIWAEVSSSAPHLLHNGLSDNPIK
jgi:hypothetical protein